MKTKFIILATLLISASLQIVTAHESSTNKSIVVEKILNNVETSWDGTALPKYPTAEPSITMLKISVAPGTRLPRHYHSVINVGYMLEGELTVRTDDGLEKRITKGEPLIELVNGIHYGENTGAETAVILVFYVGDKKTPLTTNVK